MKIDLHIHRLFFSIIVILFVILNMQCATYSVTTELSLSPKLRSLKKSAIIFRIPQATMINYEDHTRTFQFWLNDTKKVKDITLIPTVDENNKLARYPSELERFYQLSIDGDFLQQKTKGVIYQTLREQETDIRSLMEKENLDSLILYEVDGVSSTEMEFVDFTSLVAIVDKNFDIAYLDHQTNTYDIDEFDPEKAKDILLDVIAKRLINTLHNLGYIRKK